jgi:hypothetical protein
MTRTAHSRKPCFVLKQSSIQGRGAFATRTIRKGTCIVEYAGEVITSDEADRRYDDDTMSRHHTFLFAIDAERSIDGNSRGNEARFINHSCEPNCEAVAYEGRIYIHALCTIEPGEELTYDYRYARAGTSEREARRLYPCHCGAPRCRGTILAPKPKPKRNGVSASAKRAAGKR